MMNDEESLRATVEENYDNDIGKQMYEKYNGNKTFDFYVAFDRRITPEQAKQAGWDDQLLHDFNKGIDYGVKLKGGGSLADDLRKGFAEQGMKTKTSKAKDGTEVVEVVQDPPM